MNRIELQSRELPRSPAGRVSATGRNEAIPCDSAHGARFGGYWCRLQIVIVLALILVLPAVASADILEWKDDAGVTHYTNLKGEVPSQQAVQVVVDEQVWVPQAPALPEPNQAVVVPPQDPPPPPQPRDTRDEVARAYLAGLDSGLANNVSSGGSVYINGPLAVNVPPSPTYGGYYGGYMGAGYYDDWLLPGYYPFFTTAVVNNRRRGPARDRFRTGSHGGFPSPPWTSAAGPPPMEPRVPHRMEPAALHPMEPRVGP